MATRHVRALVSILVGADGHDIKIALARLLDDDEVSALSHVGLIRGVGLDGRRVPNLVG